MCVLLARLDIRLDPFLITFNKRGMHRSGINAEGCQRWQPGPLTLVSYLSKGRRVAAIKDRRRPRGKYE